MPNRFLPSLGSGQSLPLPRSNQLLPLWCLLACLALPGGVVEGLQVSRTLGSNMVLQRAPAAARVYGSGVPGEVGHVLFGKQAIRFNVNGRSQWVAELPPTPAGGPYNITVVSETYGTTINLVDVLFGDVWFCGGQSNMGLPVQYVINASAETAAMTEQNFPTVRFFHVNDSNYSRTPFPDLDPVQVAQPWQPLTPANGRFFSAVCWFFGRDYYLATNKSVPVGLIQNQWGGTPVQAWSSPDALSECSPNGTVTGTESGNLTQSQLDPSVLWNAMVVPFLDMSLVGFTWYQGEANVGTGKYLGPKYYACAFPAMIQDWRAKFQLPDAPFLFVQLAPWCAGLLFCNTTTPVTARDSTIPDLRLSQMAALRLPRVGWAIADDLGDEDAPAGTIHPRIKQPVGQRLAAAARSFLLTPPGTPYGGPLAVAASRATDGTTAAVIVKTTATAPLRIVADRCPAGIQPVFCDGAGFEVSADGSTWQPASGVKQGPGVNQLTVQYTQATQEAAGAAAQWIRYKYIDWPLNTVVDANGFPLSVFVEPVQ